MKPMEAWSIVSANLAHLVRLRRCQGDPKGFVPAESEAEAITFKALQEMQERMYPKALTPSELKQMHGEPVWIDELGLWGIVNVDTEGPFKGRVFASGVTGKGTKYQWDILTRRSTCYRNKPTEVKKDV